MILNNDYVLAPDRSYAWFATWLSVRPAKELIVNALSTFPYAGGSSVVAVPVLSTASDLGVNGVIYPLQPIAVENVVAELVKLGAAYAKVSEWPDNLAGRIARGYWDKTIKTGIDTQKSMDEIGASSERFLFRLGVLGAVALGVFLAVR
jgi:hypothetical protein